MLRTNMVSVRYLLSYQDFAIRKGRILQKLKFPYIVKI